MKISVCNKLDINSIVDGLNSYNLNEVPALSSIWTPLEFVAKNKNEKSLEEF